MRDTDPISQTDFCVLKKAMTLSIYFMAFTVKVILVYNEKWVVPAFSKRKLERVYPGLSDIDGKYFLCFHAKVLFLAPLLYDIYQLLLRQNNLLQVK